MHLPEPKVEHHEGRGVRESPIFKELMPYLQEAWDLDTNQEKNRPEVVLCGNSHENQAEDKGLEPSMDYSTPDFESGS